MALPNNDISISLVKSAIGETTTSVSALVLSDNVNPWGFNSPNNLQQLRHWGNLNRQAPYELGAFRGYEHTWRCYSMGIPAVSENFAYYDSGNIVVNLKYFPAQSTPTAGVQHLFDVFFSRTNDFTHAAHIQVMNDVAIDDNGTLIIPLYPTDPPDLGADLTPNSSVYYKIKHVSSPDRRWDERMFIASANLLRDVNEADSFILKVDIGQDIFNYYSDFFKTAGTQAQVWKYGGSGQMQAYVTLRNGGKTSETLNMTFQINNLPDFSGTINDVATGSFLVPAASRVGGTLVYGTRDVAISLTNAFSHWNVGASYYGRVRIESVSGGTYYQPWITGFDGTILSEPPQ